MRFALGWSGTLSTPSGLGWKTQSGAQPALEQFSQGMTRSHLSFFLRQRKHETTGRGRLRVREASPASSVGGEIWPDTGLIAGKEKFKELLASAMGETKSHKGNQSKERMGVKVGV